ncbi:MAG: Maf family protein [Ginsengibacter sp.]
MKEIILASASPRRKQLLDLAAIPCKVIPANIEESYPPGLTPEKIAEHIATEKALFIREILAPNSHDNTILSADTIVVLGDEIIGKPLDRNDAIKILAKLSGNEHKVITGVCLLNNAKKYIFSETTFVQFNRLTQEQIEFYVDKFKPFDKAGAYAIQEWIGAIGIQSIRGDFYNVMGLPINRIVKELNKL